MRQKETLVPNSESQTQDKLSELRLDFLEQKCLFKFLALFGSAGSAILKSYSDSRTKQCSDHLHFYFEKESFNFMRDSAGPSTVISKKKRGNHLKQKTFSELRFT